ncbi:MAG TPA: hypothetical protein VN026_10740 [Bacteroidia bacterium]|jgi:hypothetical protein|nr:hypothetical protein [Bacteroidia bacterium]
MDIKEKYKPYNFSATKCFVIELGVIANGTYKIEKKLPVEIKTLKGIYVTCSAVTTQKIVGIVNLFFNEGSLKNFGMGVMNSKLINDHSNPIPINEEIKPNSTMQGVYYHRPIVDSYPFTIKIYLHYDEVATSDTEPLRMATIIN